MREMLCRGKRKYDRTWVYGYYDVFSYDRGREVHIIHTSGWNAEEVKPGTVGKYIGLDDKNGQMIFVGDIVKGARGQVFEVVYNKNYLQYRGSAYCWDGTQFKLIEREISYFGDKIEVIGNIYDNPGPDFRMVKNEQRK